MLLTTSTQHSSQQSEHSSLPYKPKLVYATKQNHHDDPVEIVFAVTNQETGSEETIKCEIPNVNELFEMTEEGQRWLNQQRSTGIRNIRRSA